MLAVVPLAGTSPAVAQDSACAKPVAKKVVRSVLGTGVVRDQYCSKHSYENIEGQTLEWAGWNYVSPGSSGDKVYVAVLSRKDKGMNPFDSAMGTKVSKTRSMVVMRWFDTYMAIRKTSSGWVFVEDAPSKSAAVRLAKAQRT